MREGRLGIDLCHDDVERELLKEREVIEGAQSLLDRTLEQVNEQLRRLRALIYTLVRDLDGKAEVIAIDKHNRGLKETSLNLSLYHGNTPLDPGTVTDEEWAMYTQQNIDRAAKELVSGRPIRSYIDQLLKQAIEDLWKQYNLVNDAFRRRIEEYKEAKAKLENQHFEVTVMYTYPTSGEVATEEWLVRNVEGEVSQHFFSLFTSLSLFTPSPRHLTGRFQSGLSM
ncbi:Tektin 3 [Homalodisca vitripennis]|nr:Tektin 3 [Homalodisca vitripennis]